MNVSTTAVAAVAAGWNRFRFNCIRKHGKVNDGKIEQAKRRTEWDHAHTYVYLSGARKRGGSDGVVQVGGSACRGFLVCD